jgi:hypothetical protein
MYCDGYGDLRHNGSKIHVTSPREMWALLVNGSNSVSRYNEQRPNCWIPKQHWPKLCWRQKTTLGQGILAPVREDLLNRVDFYSKSRQIKGADQRRNVRRGSKESEGQSSNQEASNQRPNQDKESTRKWRAHIVKEIVVTTNEVVNKPE